MLDETLDHPISLFIKGNDLEPRPVVVGDAVRQQIEVCLQRLGGKLGNPADTGCVTAVNMAVEQRRDLPGAKNVGKPVIHHKAQMFGRPEDRVMHEEKGWKIRIGFQLFF